MSGPNPTVWSPRGNIEGEYAQDTTEDIADASSNLLVDSSGDNLIDGGVSYTPVPTTTWSENDTA